jgi:hypothetical protein
MYRYIGKAKTGLIICASALVALLMVAALHGCAQFGGAGDSSFGANPITAESLEGLILEGEGPIPARLIYQSRNSLSTEEDKLVLETIAQELDRLVEMAGRLDEAVTDESARTDSMTPEGETNR